MKIRGFDSYTAEKIVEATRLTLAHPLGEQLPQSSNIFGAMTPHQAIIKVISTNTTDGFYRCQWATSEVLNTGNPAVTFSLQADEGWAYGLNDGGLQDQTFYLAQFRGFKPSDGKALFIANSASSVIARCVSATPQNIGGQFLYTGKTQNFRSGNLQLSDAKDCYIREVNNVETLVANNKYLGFIGGLWAADGRAIVLVEDFNLSAQDLQSGTTWDRIRKIEFDSTPTAYDNTKGDFVFTWTPSTRTLKVRHNGRTGSDAFVTGCVSGSQTFATYGVSNGLVKTKT